METQRVLIKDLYEHGEDYIKTSIELAKLKALETSTVVATALIWRLSVLIVLGLFLSILSIGIALWFGDWLGKVYYGFFIVAGAYLIIGVVLHFFLHNWIKTSLSDLIITKALQ
jgi:hypothetical protein